MLLVAEWGGGSVSLVERGSNLWPGKGVYLQLTVVEGELAVAGDIG